MNVYAPIILCFVPFITMFLLCAILVPGISLLKQAVASIAGLVAVIPIALLQFLIPELRLFHQAKVIFILLYAIVFCGLVEEIFKAASLLMVKAKDESLKNYFLYSLLAGMIFGCFETVVYLVQCLQDFNNLSIPFPAVKLIYLRMVTALIVHTLCAGLCGLCIFYCKNIRRNFSPLIYAILLHGVYDFFFLVYYDSPLKYFSIAAVLLAALECRIFYLRIEEELSSARFRSQKILDPDKTIEMPSNPALVISVKGKKKEGDKVLFKKNDKFEDFDAIQKEAEEALKKEKKNSSKKAAEKTSTKKSARTAVKKTEKTIAKKSASEKTLSKTKTVSKTAPKKTTSAKTVSSKTKTTSKAAGGTKVSAAKTASKTTTNSNIDKILVSVLRESKTKTASKSATTKSAPKKGGKN